MNEYSENDGWKLIDWYGIFPIIKRGNEVCIYDKDTGTVIYRGTMDDMQIVRLLDEKITQALGQSDRVTALTLSEISKQIAEIDRKVTTQNGNVAHIMGRVNDLEKKRLVRALDCPNIPDIKAILEWKSVLETSAMTKKEFKDENRKTIVFTSAVITVLILIFNNFGTIWTSLANFFSQ